MSEKQSFPDKREPTHRYLYLDGILECYSTHSFKVIMFHSSSRKVILDLKIFYHLLSMVTTAHMQEIKCKFRVERNSNQFKIYYSKTWLFNIPCSTVTYLREDLYSSAINSLMQLSALNLCDDKRQILHYLVNLFRTKFSFGMDLDQILVLDCFELNDFKHLANLFRSKQHQMDFVEIQISAFYWPSL